MLRQLIKYLTVIIGRMYRLGEEINYHITFLLSFNILKIQQIHVRMGLKPIAVRLRQTEQHQRLEFPP